MAECRCGCHRPAIVDGIRESLAHHLKEFFSIEYFQSIKGIKNTESYTYLYLFKKIPVCCTHELRFAITETIRGQQLFTKEAIEIILSKIHFHKQCANSSHCKFNIFSSDPMAIGLEPRVDSCGAPACEGKRFRRTDEDILKLALEYFIMTKDVPEYKYVHYMSPFYSFEQTPPCYFHDLQKLSVHMLRDRTRSWSQEFNDLTRRHNSFAMPFGNGQTSDALLRTKGQAEAKNPAVTKTHVELFDSSTSQQSNVNSNDKASAVSNKKTVPIPSEKTTSTSKESIISPAAGENSAISSDLAGCNAKFPRVIPVRTCNCGCNRSKLVKDTIYESILNMINSFGGNRADGVEQFRQWLFQVPFCCSYKLRASTLISDAKTRGIKILECLDDLPKNHKLSHIITGCTDCQSAKDPMIAGVGDPVHGTFYLQERMPCCHRPNCSCMPAHIAGTVANTVTEVSLMDLSKKLFFLGFRYVHAKMLSGTEKILLAITPINLFYYLETMPICYLNLITENISSLREKELPEMFLRMYEDYKIGVLPLRNLPGSILRSEDVFIFFFPLQLRPRCTCEQKNSKGSNTSHILATNLHHSVPKMWRILKTNLYGESPNTFWMFLRRFPTCSLHVMENAFALARDHNLEVEDVDGIFTTAAFDLLRSPKFIVNALREWYRNGMSERTVKGDTFQDAVGIAANVLLQPGFEDVKPEIQLFINEREWEKPESYKLSAEVHFGPWKADCECVNSNRTDEACKELFKFFLPSLKRLWMDKSTKPTTEQLTSEIEHVFREVHPCVIHILFDLMVKKTNDDSDHHKDTVFRYLFLNRCIFSPYNIAKRLGELSPLYAKLPITEKLIIEKFGDVFRYANILERDGYEIIPNALKQLAQRPEFQQVSPKRDFIVATRRMLPCRHGADVEPITAQCLFEMSIEFARVALKRCDEFTPLAVDIFGSVFETLTRIPQCWLHGAAKAYKGASDQELKGLFSRILQAAEDDVNFEKHFKPVMDNLSKDLLRNTQKNKTPPFVKNLFRRYGPLLTDRKRNDITSTAPSSRAHQGASKTGESTQSGLNSSICDSNSCKREQFKGETHSKCACGCSENEEHQNQIRDYIAFWRHNHKQSTHIGESMRAIVHKIPFCCFYLSRVIAILSYISNEAVLPEKEIESYFEQLKYHGKHCDHEYPKLIIFSRLKPERKNCNHDCQMCLKQGTISAISSKILSLADLIWKNRSWKPKSWEKRAPIHPMEVMLALSAFPRCMIEIILKSSSDTNFDGDWIEKMLQDHELYLNFAPSRTYDFGNLNTPQLLAVEKDYIKQGSGFELHDEKYNSDAQPMTSGMPDSQNRHTTEPDLRNPIEQFILQDVSRWLCKYSYQPSYSKPDQISSVLRKLTSMGQLPNLLNGLHYLCLIIIESDNTKAKQFLTFCVSVLCQAYDQLTSGNAAEEAIPTFISNARSVLPDAMSLEDGITTGLYFREAAKHIKENSNDHMKQQQAVNFEYLEPFLKRYTKPLTKSVEEAIEFACLTEEQKYELAAVKANKKKDKLKRQKERKKQEAEQQRKREEEIKKTEEESVERCSNPIENKDDMVVKTEPVQVLPPKVPCGLCRQGENNMIQPKMEAYYKIKCHNENPHSISLHKECFKEAFAGKRKKEIKSDGICPVMGCRTQMKEIREVGMNQEDDSDKHPYLKWPKPTANLLDNASETPSKERDCTAPTVEVRKRAKSKQPRAWNDEPKQDIMVTGQPEAQVMEPDPEAIVEPDPDEIAIPDLQTARVMIAPNTQPPPPSLPLSMADKAIPLVRKNVDSVEKYVVTETSQPKPKKQRHREAQNAATNLLDMVGSSLTEGRRVFGQDSFVNGQKLKAVRRHAGSSTKTSRNNERGFDFGLDGRNQNTRFADDEMMREFQQLAEKYEQDSHDFADDAQGTSQQIPVEDDMVEIIDSDDDVVISDNDNEDFDHLELAIQIDELWRQRIEPFEKELVFNSPESAMSINEFVDMVSLSCTLQESERRLLLIYFKSEANFTAFMRRTRYFIVSRQDGELICSKSNAGKHLMKTESVAIREPIVSYEPVEVDTEGSMDTEHFHGEQKSTNSPIGAANQPTVPLSEATRERSRTGHMYVSPRHSPSPSRKLKSSSSKNDTSSSNTSMGNDIEKGNEELYQQKEEDMQLLLPFYRTSEIGLNSVLSTDVEVENEHSRQVQEIEERHRVQMAALKEQHAKELSKIIARHQLDMAVFREEVTLEFKRETQKQTEQLRQMSVKYEEVKNDNKSLVAMNQKLLLHYKAATSTDFDTCPICIDSFTDDAPVSVCQKCNKSVHTACVEVWLCKEQTCPMCRSNWPSDLNFPPLR